MGPIRESTYYCPQSEPVKRKVYAGSATYGRIQKTLGERHVILRNSDGDTATDDTGIKKLLRFNLLTTIKVNYIKIIFQMTQRDLYGKK